MAARPLTPRARPLTGPEARPSAGALIDLYERLRGHYGPQSWWPAGSELEMVLGAILVQNTAWSSARRALDNLIAADLLNPMALLAAPEGEIAQLVRPSGYFNSKARKLKAFVQMLADEADCDLEALLARPLAEIRPLLLATYGIGPETADAICLYAARRPTFVVDAYTRRLLGRLRWIPDKISSDLLRAMFLEALAGDAAVCAEYHALIVTHGKQTCRKQPSCDACVLFDVCPTGQAEVGLSVRPVKDGPTRTPLSPQPRDWNT